MKIPSDKLIAACRAFVTAGKDRDQAEWSRERIERYESARAIVALADENARLRLDNGILETALELEREGAERVAESLGPRGMKLLGLYMRASAFVSKLRGVAL